MTIEEVFYALADRYGDELNWRLLEKTESQAAFVRELKRELGAENEIFTGSVCAVAKCDANDDVLFLIGDRTVGERWRIYHLTYSAENSSGFPRCVEFADVSAVGRYIEEQLV